MLSIEMTCLEKRLKDPNLRYVLSSMSWKFARIIIGVCFSSKSLFITLGAVADTERVLSFLKRGDDSVTLKPSPESGCFVSHSLTTTVLWEKKFFVHLIFLEIYWPPFLNRRASLFPIGVSRVSVSLWSIWSHLKVKIKILILRR